MNYIYYKEIGPMKKKVLKTVVIACALAMSLLCAALLTGCGDKAEKYTYSDVAVESNVPEAASGMESFKTMYNTMYKDSTLEVGKKIVWNMPGQNSKGEMTYKKDGDKYVLGGDFVETLKSAFSGMGVSGVNVEAELYGIKTDAGFEIVIAEKVSDMNITIRLQFVK